MQQQFWFLKAQQREWWQRVIVVDQNCCSRRYPDSGTIDAVHLTYFDHQFKGYCCLLDRFGHCGCACKRHNKSNYLNLEPLRRDRLLYYYVTYYIYIINPQVRLFVTPCISGTVRHRIMKLCMHNLHMIWKICTEKNFGKIEKKKFRNFSRIFLIFFFFRHFLTQNHVKWDFDNISWNFSSSPPPKGEPRGAEGAVRRVFLNSNF